VFKGTLNMVFGSPQGATAPLQVKVRYVHRLVHGQQEPARRDLHDGRGAITRCCGPARFGP